MKINLDNLKNPIIRRALKSRARDFMFNYGDEPAEYHDNVTLSHPIHTDYERYGDYSEREGHSDYQSSESRSEHIDITRKYEEHSDYSDGYHDSHSESFGYSDGSCLNNL